MAMLFQVVGREVKPNGEALVIEPFRAIWERDKSERKDTALREFAYVEFMCSMSRSNPYRQIPEEARGPEVAKDIFGAGSKWKPDKLIARAMKRYIFFLQQASATYTYYQAAKRAAESMQEFFLTVDLSEKNPKTGLPLYKPKDITSALIDTEKVIANLDALAKKVAEEQFEEVRTRAQKKISPFADPVSLE